MAKKPTYEELEQRVKELEEDAIERKHFEQALQKNLEEYRSIFNNINDVYYRADLEGNLIMMSPSGARFLGYDNTEEMLGKNIAKTFYSDPHEREYLKKEIMKHGKITFQGTLKRKDGELIVTETNSHLIYDDTGRPIAIEGIFRDITENKRAEILKRSNERLQQEIEARKKTEEDLRENKEKLNAMLESIGDHMSMMDKELNIIWANKIAKKIFGNDIIGKKCFEAYHKKNSPCEPYPCIALKAFLDGKVHEHHTEVIDKNGEIKYFYCKANIALRDKDEEPKAVIEISRDITDFKLAQDEKKKLETQLLVAQKMEAVGTLAGGIAHDFNNLLMCIQGDVYLMLIDIDSYHPHYERLKRIEKQVQSAATLTSQLLGYASKGMYEVKPTNLNQMVEEISMTFGRTRKQIAIHINLAEDLFTIEADQGQIEQVLLNLFINASDAMPGGGDLYLETKNVTRKDMKSGLHKSKAGKYVKLTVRDIGKGMDKSTIKRIFDPFFTTKEIGRGTGMGLASVYGIIKAHGGYIDVKSKVKQGTTFGIYLPATTQRVGKAKKASAKLIKQTWTVLIVDDEADVLKVCVSILEKIGYRVLAAKDGQEAIGLYRNNKEEIDIVLLDMIMPDMSGGEVYDRLKEINPEVKVLLSSGYSIDGEATKILNRGCDGFIQKPFDIKKLSVKIGELLNNK
jgi:two-component system cell cycle sensor histidine kinase/response regulator CckA